MSTASIRIPLTAPRRRPSPAAGLWLLYGMFFVAGVAQSAIVPLLPRLSMRFALSPTETALLLALPGLATLAVSVPAGLAADRFGARRVTLAAGLLLCGAGLAQATPWLAPLLVGRVAFGIAYGVVWTSGMAWLSDLQDEGSSGRLGPSVTCSSVGTMAGPAIGGMLAQLAGLAAPFAAIAAIAAVVLVPLWIWVPAGRRGGAAAGPVPADAAPADAAPAPGLSRSAWGRLLRRPGVGAATGALVVSGAVSGVSQLLISSGLHRLGLSTGRIGLAFSAAAVCYIAVSASVVRLGPRAHTLRFNALATGLLALALVPALSQAGAPALILALLLAAAPRAAVSTVAYALASAPEGEEGGDGLVFGMLNGAWAASQVLMPLLAGALQQHDGARAGFLVVILPSCAVAACLVLRSGGGYRREWLSRLRW